MTVYANSEQLTRVLRVLFERVSQDPAAVQVLVAARLIIRLQTSNPQAVVVLNGRKNPPQLSYSANGLLPDLDVQTSADVLHQILGREMRLRAAVATRQLQVRGPVWKSFVLETIFRSAQALYPDVRKEIS